MLLWIASAFFEADQLSTSGYTQNVLKIHSWYVGLFYRANDGKPDMEACLDWGYNLIDWVLLSCTWMHDQLIVEETINGFLIAY